ncbi:MAG: FecR domain-containing protein [Smithellaceae bacterium]|nr:FecR domain-containing protein [Smithellaceae bacterium]
MLTKVQGRVELIKTDTDRARPVKPGDSAAVGELLRSGKDASAQLVFTDDSFVILFPETLLLVTQYAYTPRDNRRSAVTKVREGRARFVVYRKRSGDSRFVVETGHASMNVGMADFFVSVSPAETEVANIGSPFQVKNVSGLIVDRVSLGANQKTTVTGMTPPSQPATLTPEQRRKYIKDAGY